jgi:hypothetical protein
MGSERPRNGVLTAMVGILGLMILPLVPREASAEDQHVGVGVHCCGVSTSVKVPAKGMRGLGGTQIGLATISCKEFLTEDTLQYEGWPQAEGKGRTIDLRSIDRSAVAQEICAALHAQGVGPGAPTGIVIPSCVQDALKEVMANYLKDPDINLDLNFNKLRVFAGKGTSTETELYLDVPEAVLKSPCELPFALGVGMQLHRLRLRRKMEKVNKDAPGTFTEEQIEKGYSADVLDIHKDYLMRDLTRYYDQHGLDGELTCCKPLELPSPEPRREPVCSEMEPFCKPRIALLSCAGLEERHVPEQIER